MEESRNIQKSARVEECVSSLGMGSEIAALFVGIGLDTDIKELVGQTIPIIKF